MTVTVTVTVQGRPLQQAYVSHFDFFRIPQTRFFRTGDDGRAEIAGVTGTTKVRVHCQNPVVRVLDGAFPVPVEVSQEFTVSDEDTITINTAAQQRDHFRVLQQCQEVYDTVWRQFSPFNRPGRRRFPFGSGDTIAQTRDRLPRIELVYPDTGVAPLAWVEPSSLGTGFPLIHVKDRSLDDRLFGTDSVRPSLIAHELSHALHFAVMPATARALIETQYLAWITSRVSAGLPPFHNTTASTTKFVAWIEALGLFGERFFTFATTRDPLQSGQTLRQNFFRDELSLEPDLADLLGGYVQAGRRSGTGVEARITGDDVEGAVYGAVFLDLARRVGLREMVGRYLNSGPVNVSTFDDFSNLLLADPDMDFTDDVLAVRATWSL